MKTIRGWLLRRLLTERERDLLTDCIQYQLVHPTAPWRELEELINVID